MIFIKTWESKLKTEGIYKVRYFYTGYFLFGIIPLLITRRLDKYI
jgi:hypothetical protein